MSISDAYKPNLKRAGKLFGSATGIAGISTNQIVRGAKKVISKTKTGLMNLERNAEVKRLKSDKVFKRVGGSQPVRVKKTPAEMKADQKRLKDLGY